MSSQQIEYQTAEERFRQAFERLKAGDTKVLERGAHVSQNNVAKEAGVDPSALKKARFPALIREIQAYLEIRGPNDESSSRKAAQKKIAKRSMEQRLNDTVRQRDMAQSVLASAQLRIVELVLENKRLHIEIDELRPPPIKLGNR